MIRLFLVFWLFFPWLTIAVAQEQEASNTFDAYIRYMPSSSAQDIAGKVEAIEFAAEFSREFKVCGRLPVEVSLDVQHIGIENSTGVKLPAHLTGLVTDIETTMPFFGFENTYQRFGFSPSFFGDEWNFDASDFRIPMRYYLIRRPNEKWTLLAGIAVYPDFEREVLPILGFIYKPNERLTFNIVPKRPDISYILNDKYTVYLEGGSSINSEFEVEKDDTKSAVLRYKQTRLGVGVKYSINNFTQAAFSLGAAFNRTFKYRDSLGKVNLDDGFYTEARIQARF